MKYWPAAQLPKKSDNTIKQEKKLTTEKTQKRGMDKNVYYKQNLCKTELVYNKLIYNSNIIIPANVLECF